MAAALKRRAALSLLNKSLVHASSYATANVGCCCMRNFEMCDRCTELDRKIEHYRQIAAQVIDKVTFDRIEKLVADLQAQKVTLHPRLEP